MTIDNAPCRCPWARHLDYDIHLENGFWQSIGTGEGAVEYPLEEQVKFMFKVSIFKPLQAYF